MASKPVEQLDSVVIRFAGDSGDGMQLTGGRFTSETALSGNDLASFPADHVMSSIRPTVTPTSASAVAPSGEPHTLDGWVVPPLCVRMSETVPPPEITDEGETG